MRRRRRAATALLISLLAAQLPGRAQNAVQWQPEPAAAPSAPGIQWSSEDQPAPSGSDGVVWEVLPADTTESNLQVTWEPLEGDALIADPTPTPPPTTVVKAEPTPSGATFANFRALWRDGDWLPQISNTVPVGFGPQGFMATFTYRAIDCTTGAGLCKVPTSYKDWRDTADVQGDAYFFETIGFGDPLKYFAVVISNATQGTAYSGARAGDPFFGGNHTGFHIIKAFSPDTSIRLGVENWIRWDWPQADLEKNAYGVISQRIRLGPDDGGWFRNMYLTAGAGNGAFRPLDEQVGAQIEAQRKAGCATINYTPPSGKDCSPETRRRAVRDGSSFGDLSPIGAVGIEVVRGFNLLGEWSGRNLNLGFSLRPFPELGFVITPMFENIVVNSDYGVNVQVPGAPPEAIPSSGLTERAKFSIQASVEFKF